jgi:hypothetical protein
VAWRVFLPSQTLHDVVYKSSGLVIYKQGRPRVGFFHVLVELWHASLLHAGEGKH